MNKHGQAARFAYDPKLVVQFFESLPRPDGYRDDIEGRIIRRWRSAHGVTRAAFHRMAVCYSTDTTAFEAYCQAIKRTPVLRDKDSNRRNH
jgi:hypothetical protein